MSNRALKHRLESDLMEIGLPVQEVAIGVRPFSKTYLGNYYPTHGEKGRVPKIYIYPWKDKECTENYPYSFLLDTMIHEMVHHLQYNTPGWVRYEGCMHDKDFWRLYHFYIFRAKLLGVIESDYECEAA